MIKPNKFELAVGGSSNPPPLMPNLNRLFSIELNEVPSYNELLYVHRDIIKQTIGEERGKGYEIGLAVGYLLGIKTKVVKIPNAKTLRGSMREVLVTSITNKRLFCYCEIKRAASLKDASKGNRKRDVYNLAVKALVDGLTDAGLWLDDNELYHSDLYIHYAGVATKAKITITFYEIGD